MRVLLLLFFLFIFQSCSEKEIEKDEIRCIVSGKIPPFSYYENYDIVGFEIELMKLIAKKINKKIIFDNLAGSQVLMNLERNYDDIAIASFVITKERQKNFFMAKYHSEQMVMLFNKKFNYFKNLDDFQKKTEKKDISSIYGVFNKDFIEWSKKNFENLKITYFFNEILTIYAMNKDFVSGVIMTKSEANSLKESNPNIYDFFELPNLKFDFGILIQKNNKKLYAKIVNAIQELENSKEMIELKEKYNIL